MSGRREHLRQHDGGGTFALGPGDVDAGEPALWIVEQFQQSPHAAQLEVLLAECWSPLEVGAVEQEADRLFVGLGRFDHGTSG